MLEFLSQYGLFLAKLLTIIIGILVLFALLNAIAQRGKRDIGTLTISNLNEKYEGIRHDFQSETLSKKELKKWFKGEKEKIKKQAKEKSEKASSRLFVTRFEGDIRASEADPLREIVSAILEVANPEDEVLVTIESAGGFVHGYGLAASQLDRLRRKKIHLTVAIDKVAASGGYLMACVANHIIAAPFAIVGSIGVMAQLPNFNRLLEKHNIDFELHTAGEYKRTLTLFGKNTDKGRQKFQEEMEETHALFKAFIATHRPQVVIEEVATGEHWHASLAVEKKLVDEIKTSDDFILEKIKQKPTFEVSYEKKKKLTERLTGSILAILGKLSRGS